MYKIVVLIILFLFPSIGVSGSKGTNDMIKLGVGAEVSGIPYATIEAGVKFGDNYGTRIRIGGSVFSVLAALELHKDNVSSSNYSFYLSAKHQAVVFAGTAWGGELGIETSLKSKNSTWRLGLFKGGYKSYPVRELDEDGSERKIYLDRGEFIVPTLGWFYRW